MSRSRSHIHTILVGRFSETQHQAWGGGPGTDGGLRLGRKASRISGWVRFSEPNCGQHLLFQIWEQVAEWS